MKVLFVSNDPKIFDAESAVHARMRAYADAIGELHIISSAPHAARKMHEDNLHLYPIHVSKLFRIRALAHAAHALIRTHGIEVVSAQDPFEHGLAALRAVQRTDAKLHVQVHTDFRSPWFTRTGGWRTRFLNRYRVRLAERVLPKAEGIRTVSKRIQESLKQHFGNRIKNPSVIPAAVNISPVASEPLPPHEFSFSLITVGRLESEKRVRDIIDAMRLLVPKNPKLGLYIVGDGRERKMLEQRVQRLGLEKSVIFLGTRTDVRGLMQSADAYVQASAYEGYGFTLIEAALARLPIITTDVGLVGEVFTENTAVLSVPVASSAALSEAIANIIEDANLRSSLSRAAHTAAGKHLEEAGAVSARIASNLAELV